MSNFGYLKKHFYENIQLSDEVVVFGTGSLAEEFMNSVKNISVIAFVDNNTEKHNTTFYNRVIYSIEWLKTNRD